MKNNTALKKLILKLKYERSQFVSEKGKYALNHAIELAELLLPVEKEQIKAAVTYGNENPLMGSQKMFSENYYKETYK